MILSTLENMPEYKKLSESDKRLTLEYYQYLKGFVIRALRKFCKGRNEHGQSLSSIDTKTEIEQEIMDITAYSWINRKFN